MSSWKQATKLNRASSREKTKRFVECERQEMVCHNERVGGERNERGFRHVNVRGRKRGKEIDSRETEHVGGRYNF